MTAMRMRIRDVLGDTVRTIGYGKTDAYVMAPVPPPVVPAIGIAPEESTSRMRTLILGPSREMRPPASSHLLH